MLFFIGFLRVLTRDMMEKTEKNKVRANVRVNGIVQGVGFRPFIHRQIVAHDLAGWIRNNSRGVELEIEGERSAVERFIAEIPEKGPALAVVESVNYDLLPELKGYEDFRILPSQNLGVHQTLISPDTGICPDCLRELFTPGDRRYRYAFINCTNCGPRFTIIRDIPYDRPKTTMAAFPMCPACAAEYADIRNRRYHAQPNCCPECGPRLSFLDADGNETDGDPVETAAEMLFAGKIVAVKGLGGFHLACRCDEAAVTERLRERKHRDAKPFALMCRDVDAARRLCVIGEEEERMLQSAARPIVLLRKREREALSHVSENGFLGVMLPYTPLHYLLFDRGPDTLVMTSANLSDMPIVYRNEEALTALRGIADGFLLHDRDIETRCDDSLLWVNREGTCFVRRSRGFVPYPIRVDREGADILAAGAEQKASFALFKGERAFLSQHIGDLKNMETLEAYERQIAHFERMFDVTPAALACDLHPDYLSTDYAGERAAREGLPLFRVQHHHAHMASCMADNGLEGDVIGVVWDGTGLGPDGTVWGGEFLTGGYRSYARRGALGELRLPGGDRAVKEIWRLGVMLLEAAGVPGETFFPARDEARIRSLLTADLNCPRSSSMGRLFDGISALLGIARIASYEGQGAVLLEAAAEKSDRTYSTPVEKLGGIWRFDWRPMVREIASELAAGSPRGEMAAAFMNTLAEMAVKICRRIREDTGLDRAVLSGGTFQNQYLLSRLSERLERDGFTVYRHRRVSCNDEGIALGQGMVASRGGENYVSCNTPEDR